MVSGVFGVKRACRVLIGDSFVRPSGLPPYLGMMMALGIFWLISEITGLGVRVNHLGSTPTNRAPQLLTGIENWPNNPSCSLSRVLRLEAGLVMKARMGLTSSDL